MVPEKKKYNLLDDSGAVWWRILKYYSQKESLFIRWITQIFMESCLWVRHCFGYLGYVNETCPALTEFQVFGGETDQKQLI